LATLGSQALANRSGFVVSHYDEHRHRIDQMLERHIVTVKRVDAGGDEKRTDQNTGAYTNSA
jgi:hypothetical protein